MEPLTSSSLDTRLAGMLHTIIIPQNMIILGLWFDGFTGSAGQNWTNLNSNSSHLVISFRVHHLMAEVVVERLIMRTTIEVVLRTYTLTLYVTLTCWCPVNGYYPLSLDWIKDYLRYYYNYWRFFWGGHEGPFQMSWQPTQQLLRHLTQNHKWQSVESPRGKSANSLGFHLRSRHEIRLSWSTKWWTVWATDWWYPPDSWAKMTEISKRTGKNTGIGCIML